MEAEAAAALTPAGGPGTRRAVHLVTKMVSTQALRPTPPDMTPYDVWAWPLSLLSFSRVSVMGYIASLQNPYSEALTPRTSECDLFGDQVFPEVIKLK